MLFVSRFSNLTVCIRDSLSRNAENEAGQIYKLVLRPTLYADFIPQALTEAQRIIAVRMFTELNPKAPWGAVPYEVDGIMGQEFADLIMGSEMYRGYNPAFNLSKYDTRTDIPYDEQLCETDEQRAELKQLVQERLMATSDFNRDYVRLDESLPKPWPAYASDAPAKKLVAQAREFGIPLVDLVDYEKTQDQPNKQIIAEAELVLAKDAAEQAERDALGAVIP